MPEEEAFCVFVKLMQDYRLRELFKPSMAELGLCMYQFECMIQVHTKIYQTSYSVTINKDLGITVQEQACLLASRLFSWQ